MLQETALRIGDRAGEFSCANPIVVCGEMHRFLVAEQLTQAGVEPLAILLEPESRNTAPAVALAAHHLAARGLGDRLLLVMPSDHLVQRPDAFRTAVAMAVREARSGRLVTFGVTPSEPATGYGYIQPACAEGLVRPVARFVEKPDPETAARYVASGHLWNAGIFLFRADTYLAELGRHAPRVAQAVADSMAESGVEGVFHRAGRAFGASPSISIDYAVMERAHNVSVVPVDMGWSDVGSWDALWRVAVPDQEGNVLRGEGALIACRASLVRNEGGPFVAALGLEDMVVVSTPDAVLIAPRGRAEDIRSVVEAVEAKGLELARTSHEVRRPWGSFRTLGRGEAWQVKQIAVKPGALLSLQSHSKRAETWVVASGRAIVTVGESVQLLETGQSIHIPVGSVHRLENPGPSPLDLIEVQQGSYLGEDDIVRLADLYGRAGKVPPGVGEAK